MKIKTLFILVLIFFLIVSTNYYWEAKLEFFALPASLVLFILYLIFSFVLLRQIYLGIRDKFKNKERLWLIAFMTVTLSLIAYKPSGLISFEGKNLLVAQREGVANCTTTFMLKENNRFIEKSVCFGMSEITGSYTLKNDTVFFSDVNTGRSKAPYYKFAVIRENSVNNKFPGHLVRYKAYSDTLVFDLMIVENKLK